MFQDTTLNQLIIIVESHISTKNKTNLEYKSVCKPHLTSRFCEIELGLKSFLNMISEPG